MLADAWTDYYKNHKSNQQKTLLPSKIYFAKVNQTKLIQLADTKILQCWSICFGEEKWIIDNLLVIVRPRSYLGRNYSTQFDWNVFPTHVTHSILN